MGSPKSIEAYSEVFQVAQRIGNQRLAGETACQIAEALISIPVAQNFEQAETWIQAGFDLPEQDNLMHSRLTALRGKMAYEKFLKARKENQTISNQVDYLNQALDAHFRALELLPEDQLSELGSLQETIGLLYLQSEGMLETAVDFYDQAIETRQQASDLPGAARAGYNLAVALFLLNDFERSRTYAQAALQVYEGLASESVIEAQKVHGFLSRFPEK
jgi:tetratricopeptide (TPR) repeat protein